MDENLVTLIQYTYTTVLPLALGYIIKTVKELKLNKDSGRETDMLVLRLILWDLHDRCISAGFITNQQFITFNEVWELYHTKYKGNHLTDKFKSEVEALPMRRETWEE